MQDGFRYRIPVYKNNEFKKFIYSDAIVGQPILEAFYEIKEPEQCTGLKDKNGNLIYEGDIVNTYYKGLPTGERYVYRWKNPAFYVEPFEKGRPSGRHWYYFAVGNNRCEIIGNIHENQELLEK